MLATGLRRRWNKAALQAQALSHHSQNSAAANALLRISNASRQITATKLVCCRLLLALFGCNGMNLDTTTVWIEPGVILSGGP